LQNGLEAATIILFIINTPDIDRRIVGDDAIRGVITLMRLHLSRHLIPALNQTGNFTSEAWKKKDSSGSPPTSKRRRVSENSEGAFLNTKDVKKVYKCITATIGLQLTLMERIEGLMLMLPLDDQQVLMLTSGVLPVFEVDSTLSSSSNAKEAFQARQLQTTSISVLTAAFRKYPMHRDIVLEDLFPIMLSLPTGKRSLRTFPVRYSSSPSTTLKAMNTEIVGSLLSNGTEPHHIQMMTALILSLVHSCVHRPSYVVEESNAGGEGNTSPATSAKLQSGLRSSIVVADTFVRCLLKRCTKGKGDSVSEYRPVLINIVEDLLLVLTIPEYPAAELLLAALQRRLNQDLSAASPIFKTSNNQQQQQLEVTYLNCALDVMGKICSVQARLLSVAEDKSLRMITEVPMSNTSSSEHVIDCHCKKQNTDVLRVQCEQCNSIFHGKCVGLPDEESIPEQWFCDRCVLGRIIVREQHRTDIAEEGTLLFDRIYAMRYAFQSATTHQMCLIDDNIDDPIKFHLARWIDEIDQKKISQTGLQLKRLATSKILEYWDSCAGLKPELLSDEGSVRVIVSLLTQTSQFFLSFRKQVEFLVKHLSDENPQVLRKLSLKVIEKVSMLHIQTIGVFKEY
jgi:cohesin loading factor subunit SCC2